MIKLIKSTFYRERETKKKLGIFIGQARQLSFGKICASFEKRFAQWQLRRDAILVTSGSMANLALIQALLNLGRIKKGDRVGFSAITWSTNVMPLIQLGLNPVPIDIEAATLNISSENLLKTLHKSKIKLLFLTNLLGLCSDIDIIRNICRKEKVILIEDNCESLGSVYHKIKLGNFGLAATFSFYVGHHLSTIEGGAVVTDDPELATMLRLVRAHGWDRNLDFTGRREIRKKYAVNSEFYSRYTFYDLGFNMRPTEIVGFLGNCQLKYLGDIIRRRQENFYYFAGKIYQQKDLYYPVKYNHLDLVSGFAFPLICKSREIRENTVRNCDGKIEIRPIVAGNMLRQPFFRKYIKSNWSCPNADLVHQNGLYFGNNPEMTIQEKNQIIRIFTGVKS